MRSPTSASRTSINPDRACDRIRATHMFGAEVEDAGGGARKYRPVRDGAPLTWADVLDLWRGTDDSFRLFFIGMLKASACPCFRLETPAVTSAGVEQAFEFVLVDSPEIDLPADPRDFQGYFDGRPDDVLVFANLGGDATMVVPRPREGITGYAHIAGFVNHAPMEQQLLLWKTTGETLHEKLGKSPLWLNTTGGGVPWLHVRIDSQPKYYVFDEYKAACGR